MRAVGKRDKPVELFDLPARQRFLTSRRSLPAHTDRHSDNDSVATDEHKIAASFKLPRLVDENRQVFSHVRPLVSESRAAANGRLLPTLSNAQNCNLTDIESSLRASPGLSAASRAAENHTPRGDRLSGNLYTLAEC